MKAGDKVEVSATHAVGGARWIDARVVRTYADPAEMLEDGFVATDAAYLAAVRLRRTRARDANGGAA